MREWLERARQGLDLPAAPEPYQGNLAPIYTCAAAGRKDAIELLLAAGWDVNCQGEGGRAAVAFPEMREFLLSQGARLEIADCYGQTPLFQAVLHNQVDRVATMLTLGAVVDHADQEGRTPLWLAARRRHLEILDLLLAAGAHPDHADHQGVTPLMKARHRQVQRRLLRAGARSDRLDHHGRSVFQYLCHRPESLRSLLEQLSEDQIPLEFRLWFLYQCRRRADFEALCLERLRELLPDRPIVRGQSVLWWAARLGSRKCCLSLLEAGWDPLRPDQDRRTPIDASVKAGCPKLTHTFRDFSGPPHRLP